MHVSTDANDSPPLTDDEGGGDSGDNTETTQSSVDRTHMAPTSALGNTGALGAAVIGAAMQAAVHTGICARAPRTHYMRGTAGRAKNVTQQLPPAQLMYTASPAQAQLSAVHTQIDQLLREARLTEEKIATERSMSGHV
jgi:hypothetical protein